MPQNKNKCFYRSGTATSPSKLDLNNSSSVLILALKLKTFLSNIVKLQFAVTHQQNTRLLHLFYCPQAPLSSKVVEQPLTAFITMNRLIIMIQNITSMHDIILSFHCLPSEVGACERVLGFIVSATQREKIAVLICYYLTMMKYELGIFFQLFETV